MHRLHFWLILLAALLIGAGSAAYFIGTGGVRVQADGTLQDGTTVSASAVLRPQSPLPFGDRSYQMVSLELRKDGVSRSVPGFALADVEGMDPGQRLQVFEEGPNIVLMMRSTGGHSIQWRFLNGQFAQRRILKDGEVLVKNAEAVLQAPSIVENIPPDAPRRLQAPSLLPPSDEGGRQPGQNSQ